MILMKALSIRQPWANMLIRGTKDIEIRHWKTPYRGILLIHASKKVDTTASAVFNEHTYPRGCIIGKAELTDIKKYVLYNEFACDHHRHLNQPHWFEDGLYGWVFTNQKEFSQRIHARGRLGLFPVKIEEGLVYDE